MKSIITALFQGEIRPSDQHIPTSEAYRAIQAQKHRRCEEFRQVLKELDPELDKQFIQVLDGQLDGLSQEYFEMFLGGFRLGAKLMLEIFQDELSPKEEDELSE